jgi:hypothetical protein
MAREKENGIAGWMGIQTVSWAIGFWSCDSAALAWEKIIPTVFVGLDRNRTSDQAGPDSLGSDHQSKPE